MFMYNSTWKDLLATLNGTTQPSDAIGNLTSNGTWTYTWEAGRRLAQMSKSGMTVTFAYNENGLRVRKTVTTTSAAETEFTWQGAQVMHAKTPQGRLHFYYDGSRPSHVDFNGTLYTYVYSLQGDVLGLRDGSGTLVVQYRYDAWGRQISKNGTLASTLGTANPFRYRGYIYDEEIELYYLQTRYYSPYRGRFISPDSLLGKVGAQLQHNLFCYCGNSPVNRLDITGNLYLSMELYTIALAADEDSLFDFTETIVGYKLERRLRHSAKFMCRVYSYIQKINSEDGKYENTEPMYWSFTESLKKIDMSELDLSLSIGHIDKCKICVEEEYTLPIVRFFLGRKYKVTYCIMDEYDFAYFDPIEKGLVVSIINNSLGYDMQESGIIKTYNYTVSGSFYIYYGW